MAPGVLTYGSPLSGPRVLYYDLTTEEIKTLFSAPVTVLPAQGVGTTIAAVAATFQYKAGSVGFTNDDTMSLGVGTKPVMNSGTAPDGTIAFSIPISQVSFFLNDGDNEPQANHENGPLVLSCDTQDPGGSGDGTGRLTVLYYVMKLR